MARKVPGQSRAAEPHVWGVDGAPWAQQGSGCAETQARHVRAWPGCNQHDLAGQDGVPEILAPPADWIHTIMTHH